MSNTIVVVHTVWEGARSWNREYFEQLIEGLGLPLLATGRMTLLLYSRPYTKTCLLVLKTV